MLASASTVYAQENHNFAGSYVMTNFYMDYITEDFGMDDLPLIIDEDNKVQNFANYTPFSTINAIVEGNVCTLTSEDQYLILDIDWETFDYIILNGETFGEEFEPEPVVITYNPEDDTYEMTSWMLWRYSPFTQEYTQLGYCMVFDLHTGEIYEDVDYTGTYTVKGIKTVYTNGVASEEPDSEFVMALQPESPGFYEFTAFAGYEVGLVPRGWLGVYGAVYGTDIELQGTDIELKENGDGIKLAGPFETFDDMYTVTIFFDQPDSGHVSDFSVWRMEEGEPVELLAKWSYLSFTPASGSNGINAADDAMNAADEKPVYYNLNGIKVENPSNGIFIMKKGSKTSKVIIR